MNTDANQEGHEPENHAHGQGGCGDDAEQNALQIEEAKANLAKADDEERHAIHDREEAEHELEKAEHDLGEVRRDRVIHFKVDGEDYETKQRKWTPNEIIKEFPKLDPASNYLVRIDHKESFQGKGDIPIELHDREEFQVVSTGPTPVSDGTQTGVAAFVAGLTGLGHKPVVLPKHTDHVYFDYIVENGTHAGKQVRLGFVVPADFPLTAPSGPHLSPRIHPFKDGGEHPTGGVLAQSGAFEAGTGGEWQYWSRPYQQWRAARKSVATYMAHVRRLWDSQ